MNRSIVSLASYRTFSSSGVRFINYRRESKAIKSLKVFSSIKESSHEHRFISYDSQGKRGMHVFECSLKDTLALRMSGSQDRYFANFNNIRPTKLSREVDIFKFITEPLPLNTA